MYHICLSENKHATYINIINIFLAPNRQGNPLFSWKQSKNAKKILDFLGGPSKWPRKCKIFLAVHIARQKIYIPWLFSTTANKTKIYLAVIFWAPRKLLAAKAIPVWCSGMDSVWDSYARQQAYRRVGYQCRGRRCWPHIPRVAGFCDILV